MAQPHFWNDHSGRLTFSQAGVDSAEYPDLCRAIVQAFDLQPAGNLAAGMEQVFCDFCKGDELIGIDWDIWMEFMVVAKSKSAEPLVREIGQWVAEGGMKRPKES